MKQFFAVPLIAAIAFVMIGCTTHDVVLDNKGMKLHEDQSVTPIGHIRTSHYHLSLLYFIPILPPGDKSLQVAFDELLDEAAKHGTQGVTDVKSSIFAFPIWPIPPIFWHSTTMQGNMYK